MYNFKLLIDKILFFIGVILFTLIGLFILFSLLDTKFKNQNFLFDISTIFSFLFCVLLIINYVLSQFNIIKENYRNVTNSRKFELIFILLLCFMLIITIADYNNLHISGNSKILENIFRDKQFSQWISENILTLSNLSVFISVIVGITRFVLYPDRLTVQIWGVPFYQKWKDLIIPYSSGHFSLSLHNYGKIDKKVIFFGIYGSNELKKIFNEENWNERCFYPGKEDNKNLPKSSFDLKALNKDEDTALISINIKDIWKYFSKFSKKAVYYYDKNKITGDHYWDLKVLDVQMYIHQIVDKQIWDNFYNKYLFNSKITSFNKQEVPGFKNNELNLCAVYYVEDNSSSSNLVTKHFVIKR